MTTRSENESNPISHRLGRSRPRLVWISFLCAGLVPCGGCTDGPFFHMKKLNPYIQNQWRQDREKVVVPSQRIAEIRLLKSQIASMTNDEQAKWIRDLDELVQHESSSEIRREAVLALKPVNDRPDALVAMTRLTKDKNDFVRLAVVDALHKSPSDEAGRTLLNMAASDPSNNIRLKATQALGGHRSPEIKQYLANKLEDRNPAMQYHVSLALKEYTGKNYGGDMEAWKGYLAGENVPEPRTSIAETLESLLPITR